MIVSPTIGPLSIDRITLRGQLFHSRLPLICLLLIVTFICLPYLDFVPMWDAGAYLGCVRRALDYGLHSKTMLCLRHPSPAYILPLALSQKPLGENVFLLNLTNLLLALASIAAFHEILRKIFYSARFRPEIVLLTAIYAFLPAFLAHVPYINPDFGVLTYMLIFLFCLLNSWTWLAFIVGMALLFSKESGLPIYLLSLAAYAVIFHSWRKDSLGAIITRFRQAILLIVPVLLYASFLVFQYSVRGSDSMEWFRTRYLGDLYTVVFNFDPFHRTMQAFLFDIFVLNFNWLMTAVIAAFLIWQLYLLLRRQVISRPQGVDPRLALFFFILFLGTLYALTRVRPMNNLRLLLPIFPLLIIIYYYALLSLVSTTLFRKLILSCTLLMLVASNFRTIDPLSKSVTGTFAFGEHHCLRRGSMLDHDAHERDTFVYNLEHQRLHDLQNKVLTYLGASEDTLVFASQRSGYQNPGFIDRRTHRRTISREKRQAFRLVYIDRPEDLQRIMGDGSLPRVFYFLKFPNHPRDRLLRELKKHYSPSELHIFNDDGYKIKLYRFHRTRIRSPAQLKVSR